MQINFNPSVNTNKKSNNLNFKASSIPKIVNNTHEVYMIQMDIAKKNILPTAENKLNLDTAIAKAVEDGEIFVEKMLKKIKETWDNLK